MERTRQEARGCNCLGVARWIRRPQLFARRSAPSKVRAYEIICSLPNHYTQLSNTDPARARVATVRLAPYFAAVMRDEITIGNTSFTSCPAGSLLKDLAGRQSEIPPVVLV